MLGTCPRSWKYSGTMASTVIRELYCDPRAPLMLSRSWRKILPRGQGREGSEHQNLELSYRGTGDSEIV
jgi:hypothetical protein